MPLPEGYLPRKGDVLLIQVKVNANYDSDHYREDHPEMISTSVVGSDHRTVFVNMDQIHALHCRKWNEGDKVITHDTQFEGHGEVIGVYDDSVWVKSLEGDIAGCLWTVDANDLEPWVETDVVETVTEQKPDWMRVAPCGGELGSQSIVGDDNPIAARDEAANR